MGNIEPAGFYVMYKSASSTHRSREGTQKNILLLTWRTKNIHYACRAARAVYGCFFKTSLYFCVYLLRHYLLLEWEYIISCQKQMDLLPILNCDWLTTTHSNSLRPKICCFLFHGPVATTEKHLEKK